ncbi:MAG TPA: adenylate/guanylate cyclase domain-containing protein [Nocardioidaceae bacterium]|nr:adenylate/guanylate cyclase domain-containing protein [Nocardioidaceae bacterium]
MPDRPSFTLADAAARTGIPEDVVRRLWRALGFAIPGPGEAAFDAQDLAALELVHGDGSLDVDTEVRLARAVGQTMARLADWQVSTLSSPGHSDVLGETAEQVLVYAWRRHLDAASSRAAAMAEDDLQMVTNTVGFVDIVAFSALSNQLSDDRIGDLVELFETRAGDVVSSLGGRVIKTLGDSVLFVAEKAPTGMDIAHGIIDVIGEDARLPDVRLGIATGPVILRFGDVFGPPVNLAARLTAIARRNRVITDESTARLLPEQRYETRALTARPVRGFGVLEPITVRRV